MPDSAGSAPQSSALDNLTSLTEAQLARLACPVCFSALRSVAQGGIACLGCGRVYPLIEGIPVLIAERATAKS
jgi:uncharacterized protein YbaR (Trm112 family)